MLTARLAAEGQQLPPVMLIHGAANSAPVWTFWEPELAALGWPVYALNLRGHGLGAEMDLSNSSMDDYAADVAALARQLDRRPVLLGWSMGGLVAMMVAADGLAAACVGLAPSMPARTIDPSAPLRTGEFGAEEYGIVGADPADRPAGSKPQPAMPDLDLEERRIALASLCRESRLARDERRRGVVVESLPCPLLIVTGTRDTQWPRRRYDGLWLPADHLEVEGASHWGLVLNRRVLPKLVSKVAAWMEGAVTR